MAENVLTARNVSKSFAGVKALKRVSLSIRPGETHCLAGENGSGKSTLIKIISGVYSPDAGSVSYGDKEYSGITPAQAIANGVQVIYQDFSVFPNLSVMENLALTTELSQRKKLVNWHRIRTLAEEAAAKIDFVVDLEAIVGELSVADKQLVAICRALMSDAKLLIMDEPTTALTTKEVDALFSVVRGLKAQGISILFVSHKLEEVFEISDRFTILRNGEVVATCLPEELDRKRFQYYMTGREFEESYFDPEDISSDPALSVEGLSLKGGFTNVSFEVKKGEILGITGLLGSGRTELALALFGVHRPDLGTMTIDGKNVKLASIRDAIKKGIGYVPEDRLTEGLFLERSIGDNIIVAEIDQLVGAMGLFDKKKKEQQEHYWIDQLSIATKDPDNAANTLSGGNQQRIVLAKWLATKPKVLVLNGPTVGVDIGSKHDIHQILRALAREGMAVVIISDDIPEIIENCNRVLIMQDGRITAEVDPHVITETQLARMMTGGGE